MTSTLVVLITSLGLIYWQFRLRRTAENALKSAKHLIQAREKKIQIILDNAPVVFSGIDSNGVFHISEGKGLQKLGRKSNESVGVSIYEMHNQNPIILDAVRRALQGEQVATSFILKGVCYELYIGPEKDKDGNVIGASMLSIDITDRKKMEEEKAQLIIREQTALATTKLKSEFLATMSHEIRTPINGVLGMASLLLDTPLTEQQKEFAEAIHESGSGLLTVINDILDFSKIESGKLDFEEIHFELSELIQHAMRSLGFIANRKGIELITSLAPDLPTWVKGDPGRFRQVLNNLVGNAIKFTTKGKVTVRVSTAPTTVGRSKIRVEIEDTGVGISKAGLSKMFLPFSQAEASMSRRFGGTGLGLSISRQLVEKMGGEIGVTSVENVGSTFWFVLPFAIGQMPVQEDAPVSLSPIAWKSGGELTPRVLVVEDNRVNQIITVKMLAKMGLSAQTARDGVEGLEELKKAAYDLVLMDCQMPRMDGLEATRLFRQVRSELNQNVPIIAMTANAMKGDRENCITAGMDDYISKPISYEELNTVVARWLEIRRKRLSA